MINGKLIINGREEASDRTIEVASPADTRVVLGSVPDATSVQVDAAVEAAATAFPEWSSRPLEERQGALLAAAGVIHDMIEEYVPLLSRENGKILEESKIDLEFASGICSYTAGISAETLADQEIRDTGGRTLIRRRPIGPVAAITPWNFPVVLSFMKLAPALVAGNTVVLKPSENSPLVLTEIIRALQQHFPPGVLNMVTGGDTVGETLVSHPLIRKIGFTGGIDTGRKVMTAAAQDIKRVTLELGGNDPAIVLDDLDLSPGTMRRIAKGAFGTTGQVCFGLKRIYVPTRIHDRFVEAFCSAVDEIVVGPGDDPRSTMGPLNNAQQKGMVEKIVEDARASGAIITTLGQRLDTAAWEHGHFMMPSVITEADPRLAVVEEEQFGPVVPVLRYDELDEVIRLVNQSQYGLAASIWTSDEERAFLLGRRLDTGSVFVNSHTFTSLDPRAPFGGAKRSGLGREFSPDSLHAYTELQTISRRTGPPGPPLS
ncbi:aldehyde dehydrogenase [Mycolicibacterium aromaticivorans JS19b1 = JCM 16368]|uniref:Aldehyde dehydrogenase n=1 Tax=Mycolicibacterium aromaticivorans JS19b1 = JCM 16368 TaxID=1440774 RepID=A0A064CAJ0_9MYCO|nr:aldehyde dehydrogenase family protein [Mycolicibacterium aromaticivorans]KDE97315.1 aldehyde dehydrogenase [Mycolicibacterium aromaticivorans JS19b1 = JCM 16368]